MPCWNIRRCRKANSKKSNSSSNCAGWKTAGRSASPRWPTMRSAWTSLKTSRGWKNSSKSETAQRGLRRAQYRNINPSSRLPRQRTSDHTDAVGIRAGLRADQKHGIRIHGVGRKVERPRRWEVGCHRERVWTGAWRGDGERSFELNIEELRPRSELVEIHDAAGVIPGGRSQLHLPDKVLLIAAYAGPDEREVARKRSGRDRAGGLRQKRSVACDAAVRLLKNCLRWRNQIENEGKSSGVGVRPCCGTAAQPIGIDSISPGDCAALRRKERKASIVVLIEKYLGNFSGAICGEAPGCGNGPRRTAASDQKCKAAVQRSVTERHILLCKRFPGKRVGKIGAEQFQASAIDDIECKIVPGNVRRAAAKVSAVAICIYLIERARWKKLLVGGRTRFIGVKQASISINAARAICRKTSDDRFGIQPDVDAREIKDVTSRNRWIGESRRVLSLERTSGRRVHVGLRNDPLCRGSECDAVISRPRAVLQGKLAAAIGTYEVRAVGELQGENPRAHVDILKTTRYMTIAVSSETPGSREEAGKTGVKATEFRARHRESVLALQACVGKVPHWRRWRRSDHCGSTVASCRNRSKQDCSEQGEALGGGVHRGPAWMASWERWAGDSARAPARESGAPFAVRSARDCPPFWITRTRKTLPCRVAELAPTTLTESPFAREKWLASR